MLFHTPEFLVFFGGLLVLLGFFRKSSTRKLHLLIASYVFYMWWNPAFVLLILFSTGLDFLVGRWLGRATRPALRKGLLALSLTGNLGLLAYFKYAGLLSDACLYFLRTMGFEVGWTTLHVVLPVGISFYTFQTLSYTIDIYRGDLQPTRSPLDFALFVAFFPQLVAGPIVRAAEFLPQLEEPVSPGWSREAFFQVLRGLSKKVLIADNLSPLVEAILDQPSAWPSLLIWLAAIAFSVQIYCDFSGYSDMAIGLARFLGFELPRNFDHPYLATNPRDFWRRWHISLSTWLRDYLYRPLGGSRGGTVRTALNVQITMLLGGLWHGAGWNFVFWGFLHGLALIMYRFFAAWRKKSRNRIPPTLPATPWGSFRGLLSLGLLNYWILLTWIPFRIGNGESMKQALWKFVIWDGDLSLTGRGLGRVELVSSTLLVAVFLLLHLASHRSGRLEEWLSGVPFWKALLICFLFGLAAVLLWPPAEAPFIYFQF